jgi:hypothetical protein
MGFSATAPAFPIRAQRGREKVRRCRMAVRLTLMSYRRVNRLTESEVIPYAIPWSEGSKGTCIRT